MVAVPESMDVPVSVGVSEGEAVVGTESVGVLESESVGVPGTGSAWVGHVNNAAKRL